MLLQNLNNSNKKKIEKKNIIFYAIIGLIFLLNLIEWVNFKKEYDKKNEELLKIKSLVQKENLENKIKNTNQDFEIKNGYKYRKSNGESSTFTPRNLKYAENLINNLVSYENLQKEYCETVNEIVKVDNGIMPGTTKPFEEVTYIQVDDAYREYLQKIAQIRQVFDTIYGNDNDLETGLGCYYKGTYWNNKNSQYEAKQFYNNEIIKFLNNHGYNEEISPTATDSFNINNDNYDSQINAYCLGVREATKNNSKYTTTFKASLCRVNNNVVRNVTVIFEDNDININHDTSKNLFFVPIGYISYAKYNSSSKILNIDLQSRGTALKDLPAGYILPITSRNIEIAFAKIIDKDLIAVYGSTLGVATVSEEEFISPSF